MKSKSISTLIVTETVALYFIFPTTQSDMLCSYSIDSKHCLFALQVKPINEMLREIKGAKLLVDVVQTPFPPVKKVIQFVSGNALVCETVKEAKQIAFDGPVRLKVRS